jgi:hypothetical protein
LRKLFTQRPLNAALFETTPAPAFAGPGIARGPVGPGGPVSHEPI